MPFKTGAQGRIEQALTGLAEGLSPAWRQRLKSNECGRMGDVDEVAIMVGSKPEEAVILQDAMKIAGKFRLNQAVFLLAFFSLPGVWIKNCCAC